ncbi:MAG: secondary thiamine-phosphate synthase enzyme YjbQ [Actinomycetota bacterium]
MTVRTERHRFETAGDCDVVDLTTTVERATASSGLKNGTVTVFVPGSTAAITTIEVEPGLIADIKAVFEDLIPQGSRYAHNHGGDSNGHAHVRASIVGPGTVIPFENGRLTLGTWQQVVLIDFDDRPRAREVVIQIAGEG